MIKPRYRAIGWIGVDGVTPAKAAERVVEAVSALCGRCTGVVHFDRVTGKVVVYADAETAIPAGTFARGVRYDSDVDILIDDLTAESVSARLIPGAKSAVNRRKKEPKPDKAANQVTVIRTPKKRGPKPGAIYKVEPAELSRRIEAVSQLGVISADRICVRYRCAKSTLYRWKRNLERINDANSAVYG